MKKMVILVMIAILLCGCGKEQLPNDACEFLVNAEWEGNNAQCVNVIRFSEDKSFSNWCYCGSPVGDGDLVEGFRYRASDKAILLLDDADEIIETGKILYVDDFYLVVDVWGRCYVYENLKKERPTPHKEALELVGTEELSKPCWSILDYEKGVLKVSSCNYDGDAKDTFEVWTFDTDKEVKFSTVSVVVRNGVATVGQEVLQEQDYERIGEDYTYGYVELDRNAKVTGVVFYGETIVEE